MSGPRPVPGPPTRYRSPVERAVAEGAGIPVPSRPVPSGHDVRADRVARGRTVIADRVVAKIATQAARDTPHAGATPRWRPGLTGRGGRSATAALVDGRVALVTLAVTVDYPSPVRLVTQDIRGRVVDRLRQLADLEARQVDIAVTAFRPAAPTSGRVQ